MQVTILHNNHAAYTLISLWMIGGWLWWNCAMASHTSQNTCRMSFSLKPPSGCRSAICDINRPTIQSNTNGICKAPLHAIGKKC